VALLVEAVVFALVAAFFPAGLATVLWLLGLPQGRARAGVYLAGAACCTLGSGVVILILLGDEGGLPDQHPAVVASARLTLGVLLLVLGALIAARRSMTLFGRQDVTRARPKRLRYGWIFLLGVVMWTPSLAYVAALGLLAAADLSFARRAGLLVLVDAVVLFMVEVPLVIAWLAPKWVTAQLHRLSEVLITYARSIGLLTAGVGGLYLTVTALRDLIQN
jgi:Sap, sulfolipid-1-addressing protein